MVMTKQGMAKQTGQLITEYSDYTPLLCPEASMYVGIAREEAVNGKPMKSVLRECLRAAYWQGHHDALIEAAAKIGPDVV